MSTNNNKKLSPYGVGVFPLGKMCEAFPLGVLHLILLSYLLNSYFRLFRLNILKERSIRLKG